MMAVTMPTSAIDPQNDELNDAEKNNFPDSVRHARGNNDPRDNRDPNGKQQRHGAGEHEQAPRVDLLVASGQLVGDLADHATVDAEIAGGDLRRRDDRAAANHELVRHRTPSARASARTNSSRTSSATPTSCSRTASSG